MQHHLAFIIVTSLLVTLVAAGPIFNVANLKSRGELDWAIGTDANCADYYVPRPGDYCDQVAKENRISTKWFMKQNRQINEKCTNLWTDTKYCVSPPQGQPGKDTSEYKHLGSENETKNNESDHNNIPIIDTFDGPGIVFDNRSPQVACFGFELNHGAGAPGDLPQGTDCHFEDGSYPGIIVPAGQRRVHHLSPVWGGAITSITRGRRGCRHEMMFGAGTPPSTFYNADYEFGISPSTFGPLTGQQTGDGRPSLVGEKDPLDRANQRFKTLNPQEKSALLNIAGNKYMKADSNGELVYIHNEKETAPPQVWYFYQIMANFRGYIMPGSIVGQHPAPGSQDAELVNAADKSTHEVDTMQLLLTVWPDHRKFD